ncbi:MAG: carboxypeptidase regulatory-like domain-containing protein [Gemmatimonadetes bacterium]|nr:carboxypeptidase regulatory-like domain-containing protein [Gemmatimonadota bacterium]
MEKLGIAGHSIDSRVGLHAPGPFPHLARMLSLVTIFSGFLGAGILVATPLGAQGIAGTLVQTETGAPIEGASVVLLNRSGDQVDWRLTDASGRFGFPRIQAGTYLLRADRIGHASVLSDSIMVEPGVTTVYRLETPVEAILLAGIDVTSSSRCELRPGRGASTAAVWEEARKALEATSRTTDLGVYRYVIRHYERELDDRGREVRSEQSRIQRGVMANPFLSLNVEILLERGFMHSDGDGFVYYAPDADVLLSDRFLDSHCMSLTEGEGEAEGLLGLSFEPTENRGVPDISGVLWVDPEDAELQWLDYRYEFLNVPNSDRLGGKIQFYGLPNGTWIVREWYIRMPLLEATLGIDQQTRLIGLREQGSLVLSVNNLQGDLVLDSGAGIIEGVVLLPEGSDPVVGVVVLLDDSTRVTTDEDGRFRFTALAQGYHGLRVFNPVLDSLGLSAEPVFFEVSAGEVTSASLRFSSIQTVLTEKCGPVERPGFEGILTGFALDENGDPLPGARVSVAWEEFEQQGGTFGTVHKVLTTSELPDDALFLVCGLPRDRAVDLTVEWNGIESRIDRFQLSRALRVSRRNITIRGGR